MTLPFEERPLIESNPFIFELYAESEAQYMARNWRRLNLTAEDSIPHSSTTSSSALSTNIPPSTQPHRSALSIISSSSSRDRPSSSRSRSKFEHILTLDEFYFPEWLPISLPLCITQTLAVPLANGRILNDLDLYELNE